MTALIRPNILHIEANASCQLRCPTCPTTSKGYPPVVGSGYLRQKDLKKLLENNPYFENVQLANRGELFLNPELLQIIKLGFKKNIAMTADSGVNLNHVGDGVLEGLVKYKFNSILCSIDGATPETYRIYRIGGNFKRVIKHIEIINKYKKKYQSIYPKLTWQFVVFGHNEHEIPLARKMAKSLNMSFKPKMSWDPEISPIRNIDFVLKQTGWPAVSRDEYEKVTKENYSKNVCYSLWHSPRINWDGKVLGCCWNSWDSFDGNVFKDGYLSAINNYKITHARKMLLGQAKPLECIPCTTCTIYQKMRKSGRYLLEEEIFDQHSLLYRGARYLYHHIPALQRLKKIISTNLLRCI